MEKKHLVEVDFMNSLSKSGANSESEKLPVARDHPRPANYGGLQGTLSKINPELVKSVMAARMGNQKPPGNPLGTVSGAQPFNLSVSNLRSGTSSGSVIPPENSQIPAPMTIFYNGTVNVYNITADKAEKLMWLATNGQSPLPVAAEPRRPASSNEISASDDAGQLQAGQAADLPIARRKSLQRFLEKRKDRLTTSTAPYGSVEDPKGKSLAESSRS